MTDERDYTSGKSRPGQKKSPHDVLHEELRNLYRSDEQEEVPAHLLELAKQVEEAYGRARATVQHPSPAPESPLQTDEAGQGDPESGNDNMPLDSDTRVNRNNIAAQDDSPVTTMTEEPGAPAANPADIPEN